MRSLMMELTMEKSILMSPTSPSFGRYWMGQGSRFSPQQIPIKVPQKRLLEQQNLISIINAADHLIFIHVIRKIRNYRSAATTHSALILVSKYSASFLGQRSLRYLLWRRIESLRELLFRNQTSYIIYPFFTKEPLIADSYLSRRGNSLLSFSCECTVTGCSSTIFPFKRPQFLGFFILLCFAFNPLPLPSSDIDLQFSILGYFLALNDLYSRLSRLFYTPACWSSCEG